MHTPLEPRHWESGTMGPAPVHWFGTGAIDGDATAFARAPKGSTYARVDLTNRICLATYIKLKEDGTDSDWCEPQGCITETVTRAQFTDGGSTTGTYTLKQGMPKYAFVTHCIVIDVTGFTGDTSATLQIGDGSDVDRYSTGTPSIFTTVAAIDMGGISGVDVHTAANDIVLTVTSASDFTNVTAGQMTIRIYYNN